MPLVDLPSVPLDCEKSVMPSLEDLRYDSLLIASGLEARFSKKLVKLMEGKFGFFFFSNWHQIGSIFKTMLFIFDILL